VGFEVFVVVDIHCRVSLVCHCVIVIKIGTFERNLQPPLSDSKEAKVSKFYDLHIVQSYLAFFTFVIICAQKQ
jgi:hypothetical protein